MSSEQTQRRTARKAHRCITCGRPNRIQPGDVHLEFVIFPSEDGHPGSGGPFRGKECDCCATRYGRDYLLLPMPEEQAHSLYTWAMQNGFG